MYNLAYHEKTEYRNMGMLLVFATEKKGKSRYLNYRSWQPVEQVRISLVQVSVSRLTISQQESPLSYAGACNEFHFTARALAAVDPRAKG